MRHDVIESDELLDLEAELVEDENRTKNELSVGALHGKYAPALVELLNSLDERKRDERKLAVKFLNLISSRRCRSSRFPYAMRLLCCATLNNHRRVTETPAALLELRRSQSQRAEDVDKLVKNFVFCVPKADSQHAVLETNVNLSQGFSEADFDRMLLQPVRDILHPFQRAQARLSSFFPDRKLVQFDAGKLQTLAELLRELKRGGHRALIFTQMSKMLDILETFLNLNGYTYLRLDGSTSVERRQRLMDRFNSDTKVFCFILSTRSGGLGINLTGADSVIFYDQDWNPAM
jgi:SNF2 family DNA or RNA helicase